MLVFPGSPKERSAARRSVATGPNPYLPAPARIMRGRNLGPVVDGPSQEPMAGQRAAFEIFLERHGRDPAEPQFGIAGL